jgi:hypothetical protein
MLQILGAGNEVVYPDDLFIFTWRSRFEIKFERCLVIGFENKSTKKNLK